MNIFQLWWPFIKQQPGKIGLMITLGIVSSYCTLLLPLSIGKFMEIVFHTSGGKSKALHLLGIHLQNTLPAFFIFFGLMLLVKFFSNWGYRLIAADIGDTFVTHLRQLFFSYYLSSMSSNHPVKSSVLLPFSNDVKQTQEYLVKGVIGFTKDCLFLMMSLYVLFALQPGLSTAVVALSICFYLFYRWMNYKSKPLSANKRKRQANLLNFVSESLLQHDGSTHHEIVRVNFTKKIKKLALAVKKLRVVQTFLAAFTPFLLYLMLGVLLALIAWGGNYITLPGANDAVTYILLLMMVFPVFRSLLKIETIWMEGKLSANKFAKTIGHLPGKGIMPEDTKPTEAKVIL